MEPFLIKLKIKDVKGDYTMQSNFKFRAALKAGNHSIMVIPEQIFQTGYMVDLNSAEREFEKKYPSECFWDFIEEIKKQPYIQEISADCDLIITCDFTNLMQSTGVYDSTKFKELSAMQQEEWLKNNKAEDWHGIEIFTGDITQIKYGKDRYEYGVVYYSENSAGFYRGGTSVGSYKKQTKIVGNIYEGWPNAANYDVEFYFRDIARDGEGND